LSIVSLHVVHIPYWYDGILQWHYVFETAPLLLVLAGVGAITITESLRPLLGRRMAPIWVTLLLLSGLLPSWVDLPSLWGSSRVSLVVQQQAFSRSRIWRFRQLTTNAAASGPILVLVDESGTDPQLSYIINPPDLQGPVLVCRRPDSSEDIQTLQRAFPKRRLMQYDLATLQLHEL
ncbi:MAG: hypothetical protein KDA85_17080, partial [Planctomycetaceae bacterium]|nr:hypothetical protein [Planctomycetaceae bacterium]